MQVSEIKIDKTNEDFDEKRLFEQMEEEARKQVRKQEMQAKAPVKVDRYRKVIVGRSVESLNVNAREIARRAVQGESNQQIADTMGLAYGTVAAAKSSTPVKAHMNQLQQIMDAQVLEARSDVFEMLPDAVEALRSILQDGEGSASTRLKAATLTLGIAGLTPPKNVNIEKKSAILTGEDLREIRERAIEANSHREKIIDA